MYDDLRFLWCVCVHVCVCAKNGLTNFTVRLSYRDSSEVSANKVRVWVYDEVEFIVFVSKSTFSSDICDVERHRKRRVTVLT